MKQKSSRKRQTETAGLSDVAVPDTVVKAELEAIAVQHAGRLTPHAVVDAARDTDHALHPCFEWDDGTAAEAWRIEQARGLIRSVRIEITTRETTVRTVYFVRDPSAERQQGYVSIIALRSDAELAHEVLLEEFARAAAVLQRARNLATALELAEGVDDVLSRLSELRQLAEDRAPRSAA